MAGGELADKACARCHFERSRESVGAFNASKPAHFLDSARNDTVAQGLLIEMIGTPLEMNIHTISANSK